MNRRLFLQVAAPAVLIGAVLFLACLASVWSVTRLQADISQLLSQDVASMQAAQQLERELRQLRYHSFLYLMDPAPQRVRPIEQDQKNFEAAVARARAVARSPRQQGLLDSIASGYERYRVEVSERNRPAIPLRGVAVARWDDHHPIRHLLVPCRELIRDTRQAMDRVAEDSQVVSQRARLLLLLGSLGPLSGLLVGYGVARGLSRSIARMSVRLQDVHAHLAQEIGSLNVVSEGDIALLDRQVERIVERVKEIIEELNHKREEVLRSEQLAAVGQLAAGVAHEIRNPLTGIKMLIDVAREGDGAADLTGEDLEVIHTEVERIERKVQNLLDYARPPAPARTLVDLRDAVLQALRLIHTRLTQQGVQLKTVLPSESVLYRVDADQLAGVLVNLFLNALDAMPRGGRLTVALQGGRADGISLSVSDTGPGVPTGMQDRLFLPFASSKPTGTGLGLHTSRRVIEQHGGKLLASNLPEGGACFRIELPAVQELTTCRGC